MNTLEIIRTFCQRTGLPSPTFVRGSSDVQVTQLLGLLNEVLEDIVTRWTWQSLTKEAVFTTVAGEDQGPIGTLAPEGYLRVLNETIFNRTLRLPLFGPLYAAQWQALKALPLTGPFYKYRFRGNRLLFMPAAAAGHICAFEYASSYCVVTEAGASRASFDADTDTAIFPDPVLIAGLRWKWKAEKGFDYAEEFRRYELLVHSAHAGDTPRPRVDMGESSQNFRPGIWVPSGSWPLP